MGWTAIYRDGTIKAEGGPYGRPMLDGEDGKLLIITQEDYGHKVAIDLTRGVIIFGYSHVGSQNGTIEINDVGPQLWICDETNIGGDLAFIKQEFVDFRDGDNRRVIGPDGRFRQVRNDTLVPLVWRPIWFTRVTNGEPTKVIGAQTTLPPEFGSKNVKKMVSLFIDGRIGID